MVLFRCEGENNKTKLAPLLLSAHTMQLKWLGNCLETIREASAHLPTFVVAVARGPLDRLPIDCISHRAPEASLANWHWVSASIGRIETVRLCAGVYLHKMGAIRRVMWSICEPETWERQRESVSERDLIKCVWVEWGVWGFVCAPRNMWSIVVFLCGYFVIIPRVYLLRCASILPIFCANFIFVFQLAKF